MLDGPIGRQEERLLEPGTAVVPRSTVQDSIYRSLAGLNSDLAALYEGARQMLASDHPIEGWPHFVTHAVREVSARVPDLIRGVADPRGQNANDQMGKIARVWEQHGLSTEGVEVPLGGNPGRPSPLSTEIPHAVIEVITGAIKEHVSRESMVAKLRDAARMRARGADAAWLDRWVDEWSRSHAWAMKRVHTRPAPMEVSLDDYREEFRRFEATIAGLLGDFVTNKEGLDAVLAEANRRTD